MFLGNLSTSTERKARKAGGGQKSKPEGVSKSSPLVSTSSVPEFSKRRLAAGTRPVLYSKDNTNIPREVMLAFFTGCSTMLLDEENMEEIIQESERTGRGLQLVAAEFQRDVMERNYQIEKNFGCRFMSVLPVEHPDDRELLRAGFDFTNVCQDAYVQALQYRARKWGNPRKTSGEMDRKTILEFFEGCNARMALGETKTILKEIATETKAPPNQKVIALQREVIEWCGFDPDYGVTFLNDIPSKYPNDEELRTRMSQFALCAQIATNEAMMSAQEVKEFYSNIPLFMRNFPHMFLYQQQQMRQQQNLQMAQQAQSGKLAALMATAEGRAKLEALGERMVSCRSNAESKIKDWNAEKRRAYYDSFKEHPVLDTLSTANSDPGAKLEKFLQMNDSDLEDMLSVQLILGEDMKSGGTMLRELMAQSAGGSPATNPVLMGMQSVQQMFGVTQGGRHHDHDHSHAHHHDHAPSSSYTPDVASGRSDVMDR